MSARVLFLTRQKRGDMIAYAESLAESLENHGVEVVIDECSAWIPDKTGWAADRQVSKKLNRAIQGFDVVHAWGMRSAWACSEALYVRFPWVYSAYDLPKTKHPQLVDRLNAARRGICSSRAVMKELKSADVLSLEVQLPCLGLDLEPEGKGPARARLDLPSEAPIFLCRPAEVEGNGIEALLHAFESIRAVDSEAVLLIAPAAEPPASWGLDHAEGVRVVPVGERLDGWVAASDAVVVPDRNVGFSRFAATSMRLGRPVLMRRDGGLSEMAVDGHSGFFFEGDDTLADKLGEVLESPTVADAVGRSARIRALDRYDPDEAGRRMAELYRDLLA